MILSGTAADGTLGLDEIKADGRITFAQDESARDASMPIVGPAASLATAVQLAQLEALDAAVLDINIAGELIWPAAAELQHRRVPFLFVSALTPLIR